MTGKSGQGQAPNKAARAGGTALLAGVGIFCSRLSGVARESVKAATLGATSGIVGDAFTAAFRIPNMLQNLLGEGALSSAFIPVYTRLVEKGDRAAAGRLAGAIAALLSIVVTVAVVAGVFAAEPLVRLIAWGFKDEKFDLTVRLTRILFPGGGLFVLSAWCLGILNSHRRVLLPYLAPVVWNAAIIVALLIGRHGRVGDLTPVATYAAWGSLVGAALQFLVQLPAVLALVTELRLTPDRRDPSVQLVMRNFGPIAISRGVVQISGFVDQAISSNLPHGMPTLLACAQTVNTLPVSLFATAVAAAELPALSTDAGDEAAQTERRRQTVLVRTRHMAFLVVPAASAFILLGDTIFRVLFQRKEFTALDTQYGWAILAASAMGLLATTLARVYATVFYSMHETKTPVRFAMVRLAIGLALGWVLALRVPQLIGIDRHWGAAGLGLASGLAGWTEFALLRHALQKRIGSIPSSGSFIARAWMLALVAGSAAFAVKLAVKGNPGLVEGVLVLGTFGVVYLGGAIALGFDEVTPILRRLGIRRDR